MSAAIHPSWTAELVRKVETGMGFQVVETESDNRRLQPLVVLNARTVLEPREQRLLVSERIEKAADRRDLELLQKAYAGERVRVLETRELSQRQLLEKAYRTGSGPASEAVPEESDPDEQFLRFSAYADDIRILADGSVRAGSYVTTHTDGMLHVHSGMDAVRRYALPNPAPATHRFKLKPPYEIRIRRGTVQPANNQPGGGDEVIFDEAGPPGTCYERDRLPDGV
jgi:hypothetical protein